MKEKTNVAYFDALNIAAIFGVVLLHCNGIVHNYSNTSAWFQALAVEVAFYWPVPIFFMLSGSTLMGYRERYSTREFLKKRFARTVIPFVVWTCIAACLKEKTPMQIGLLNFLNLNAEISIERTYWFFIPLFSVYLAMPVVSLLKEHRRILWYMCIGAFILNSVLPFAFNHMNIIWNQNLMQPTMGGYLLFTVLGYLISTTEISKKKRIAIYITAIPCLLIRYAAIAVMTVKTGEKYSLYYNYCGYFSVLLAVAVFVWFKYSTVIAKLSVNEKAAKLMKTLSSCSFGVYLIHMLVYRVFARVLPIPNDSWQWRLVVPFGIYFTSVAIIFVMRKIPIVKKIVP